MTDTDLLSTVKLFQLFPQTVKGAIRRRRSDRRDADMSRGRTVLRAQDGPRRRLHLLQELLQGSPGQNVSAFHSASHDKYLVLAI